MSHRDPQRQDQLLPGWMHHVRRATAAAKHAAQARGDAYRTEGNETLHQAGHVLQRCTEDRLAARPPCQDVRAQACALLERQQLDGIAAHLTPTARFDATAWPWEHMDTLAPQCKRHVRPSLRAVEVAASPGDTPRLDAIHVRQGPGGKGRSLGPSPSQAIPRRFGPDPAKRSLSAQDGPGHRRLRPDRYEWRVDRVLRHGLEAGARFCRARVRCRRVEDALGDDQRGQEKGTRMTDTGLAILHQPIREHWAARAERLAARRAEGQQRLAAGAHAPFESPSRGRQVRWTRRSPRGSAPSNPPVCDGLTPVDSSSVLPGGHRPCHGLAAFEHVLGRYAKQEAHDHTRMACRIAWASHLGLGRLGDTAAIGSQALATTSENCICGDTLQEATARGSQAMAALPIFRHDAIAGVRHASSDGQRCATRPPTLHARYWPQDVGLQPGGVAYTLLANHGPSNAAISGAHAPESHEGFASLYTKTTAIQPDGHAPDPHGTHAVHVALLSLCEQPCAPRYRAIDDTGRTAL